MISYIHGWHKLETWIIYLRQLADARDLGLQAKQAD